MDIMGEMSIGNMISLVLINFVSNIVREKVIAERGWPIYLITVTHGYISLLLPIIDRVGLR